MRAFVPLVAAYLAHAPAAMAEDWQELGDTAIGQALTARVLAYPDGASQNFFADGRTLYEVTSGTSWGKWWVEGGKYCSTWPPNEIPSCYKVAARGLDIRFTDRQGAETVGRYVDLN